ncbi:hypothetical protein PISMIDRAFT_420003 [Pisolithus microcarpus 441]|uniref:Uncharacterized protein n=1 Tax=Pisolithus microcarpus 441 TaxID=765257 RepID=A0A0C9YY85_9AGAM|nr:hypothetical protein BKA83DRAFT_420003 [Pisolithus microcarpus]KIK12873.1 hypothetical protein PISMIDRAFT_420003 [Pisolithus microcarpus 441]
MILAAVMPLGVWTEVQDLTIAPFIQIRRFNYGYYRSVQLPLKASCEPEWYMRTAA